jgi:hypothetical protein
MRRLATRALGRNSGGAWGRACSVVASGLLLGGCDPCRGLAGPAFTDPDGLASADDLAVLEKAYGDFRAWTGSDRVCPQEIEVGAVPGDATSVLVEPSHIRVDPDAPSLAEALRWQLCGLLDDATGVAGDAPELFASQDAFNDACMVAPPAFSWEADGCGVDSLTEVGHFLADHVYVDAPTERAGALSMALDEPMELEGLGYTQVAGAGDRLVVERWFEATQTGDALLLDPLTGASTIAGPLPTEGGSILVGGPDKAAFLWFHADGSSAMYVVDGAAGTLTTTPVDLTPALSFLAVGESALYLSGNWTTALGSVDLATGVRRDLPLPAPEPPLVTYAGRVLAVAGGAVVMGDESEAVDMSSEVPEVESSALYRYSTATDEWQEQFRDLPFTPITATSTGLVFGVLGDSDPTVFAAWELDTGHLFVSDDLCPADVRVPYYYAADRGWYVTHIGGDGEPESVELRGLEFGVE